MLYNDNPEGFQVLYYFTTKKTCVIKKILQIGSMRVFDVGTQSDKIIMMPDHQSILLTRACVEIKYVYKTTKNSQVFTEFRYGWEICQWTF